MRTTKRAIIFCTTEGQNYELPGFIPSFFSANVSLFAATMILSSTLPRPVQLKKRQKKERFNFFDIIGKNIK